MASCIFGEISPEGPQMKRLKSVPAISACDIVPGRVACKVTAITAKRRTSFGEINRFIVSYSRANLCILAALLMPHPRFAAILEAVDVSLGIENILDEPYRDFLDTYEVITLSPGQSVMLTLSTKF